MLSQRLLILSLLAVASPFPHPLETRAGGLIGRLIPADCSTPSIKPVSGGDSFKSSLTFVAAYQIYSYYVPAGTPLDHRTGFRQCLEACYGFGNPGACKAILWADNVTYMMRSVVNKGTVCVFTDGGCSRTASRLQQTAALHVLGPRTLNALEALSMILYLKIPAVLILKRSE